MSRHQARISWTRQAQERFLDSKYSRAHTWEFDGGITVAASSAVSSVPLPFSKAENVDPEEALVAAISSCHMLTFLYLAARAALVVDSYSDIATGTITKNEHGRFAVTAVQLNPTIVFSGATVPTEEHVLRLHHEAHEECYIANSVRAHIAIEGHWTHAGS
jgi:organic hydroperoxide reductase OsmC/OhrA